jgi:hypothetical protein
LRKEIIMRLLLALAAIAIPPASSPAHSPSSDSRVKPLGGQSNCARADLHQADRIDKGEFNRLGELPPGQLVLTVYREVLGCHEPVVVRRNYGFDGFDAPQRGQGSGAPRQTQALVTGGTKP